MPKITQVERQKKNSKRFNIFLDGQFAFGADEDTLVNFRLLEGKEISSEQLEKLLLETEVGKLMDRVYGLLSRRARSQREIEDYLKNLSFKRKLKDKEPLSDFVIEQLILRLQNKGLINDLEFARSWVQSRGKKRGQNLLKGELMRKGISREIIDQIFEEEITVTGEESMAKATLEKKLNSWRNLPPQEFRKKATDFLMRRGFNYSLVKKTIDDLKAES